MAYRNLRIYRGPIDDNHDVAVAQRRPARRCITVPVSEVLPLLADAAASHRTWLGDFADDEVTIPADLYEVLCEYESFRRPSA